MSEAGPAPRDEYEEEEEQILEQLLEQISEETSEHEEEVIYPDLLANVQVR